MVIQHSTTYVIAYVIGDIFNSAIFILKGKFFSFYMIVIEDLSQQNSAYGTLQLSSLVYINILFISFIDFAITSAQFRSSRCLWINRQ